MKALVKAHDNKCLCTDKQRKRLELPALLEQLRELLGSPGAGSSQAETEVGEAVAGPAPSYTPSAPSELVRGLGKAAATGGKG